MDSPLWNAHIPVHSKIALKYKKAGIKRFICIVDSFPSFSCAIMPNGNDSYFILINKEKMKKWKLNFGQQVNVTLSPDTSEFGMEVPEEFEALLDEDYEFKTHFLNLTPGKQRNLLYLVGKYKSSDVKIEKSIIISEHLKANNGKLDFKMLYNAFKKD
jgi:hypothetical protein